MRRLGCLLAVTFLSASCGGGGGEPTGVSTPTPSSASTTVLTSAPSTAEIKPAAGFTTFATTMELTTAGGTLDIKTGAVVGATTSNRSVAINTTPFSLSYDTQTGYKLSDAINSATFGSAQFQGETSSPAPYPTVFYANRASVSEDYLALYKEALSTAGSVSQPKYGGIGGWQHTVPGASSRQTRLDYFAYGSPTPTSSMPRSGVVKFWLLGSGNYAENDLLYFLSQFDAVTVDFGSGMISGSIGLMGRDVNGASFGGIGTFQLAGTISGSTIDNSVYSSVTTYTINTHVQFIGPNADEILLTYSGFRNGTAYIGASIGFRQ